MKNPEKQVFAHLFEHLMFNRKREFLNGRLFSGNGTAFREATDLKRAQRRKTGLIIFKNVPTSAVGHRTSGWNRTEWDICLGAIDQKEIR